MKNKQFKYVSLQKRKMSAAEKKRAGQLLREKVYFAI